MFFFQDKFLFLKFSKKDLVTIKDNNKNQIKNNKVKTKKKTTIIKKANNSQESKQTKK